MSYRVRVEYPNGGAFEVDTDEYEDTVEYVNLALKILWGNKAQTFNPNAMTLDETDKWLAGTQ